MRLHPRFLLLHLLLLASLHGTAAELPACERTYTLALHEHGLLYSAKIDAGIDKDISDELIRRSGCKFNVSVMPRARIWQLLESGALDFGTSGIANEQRDKFAGFAWYFTNKYYLLVRKDADVAQIADFEANAKLKLGVIRSFRYSENANRLVDKLALAGRVSYSASLEPLYEILSLNRIQGMIIEPFDYSQVESSDIRAITSIIDTRDPSVPHGLIMSKAALPPAEQDRWRRLVIEMRADGTMLRIFEKYFKPDLARSMVDF